MKAKRVGIYVRVSTNEQDTEGQETELRAYVESRGWTYEAYRDKGQSGAKSVRPELTRLLGDLRKRKLDIVVVWALDRLARSLRHLLEIAEQCQSLGVDLVSLRQNIDTTLPAGRLTFQILGAVAEFEREMLRDRVKGEKAFVAALEGHESGMSQAIKEHMPSNPDASALHLLDYYNQFGAAATITNIQDRLNAIAIRKGSGKF
jgi:DNA invertase Pin-like site-specific DNA recombinase